MEKTQTMNGEKAVNDTQFDATEVAQEVLKSLVLLERSYGFNFLVRFLKGWEQGSDKKSNIAELETFGCMHEHPINTIRTVLHLLMDEKLIGAGSKFATVIKITNKGNCFLDEPYELTLEKKKLKPNKYRAIASFKLKEFRRQLATRKRKEPYELFSDVTLERIVHQNPMNKTSLADIPGIGVFRITTMGDDILRIMEEVDRLKKDEYMQKVYRQVKSPSLQETKALFLEGKNAQQISMIKGISVNSASIYLEKLHIAGEIDLKPWIEENIDSKDLFKGGEYFKEVENPQLKEAYEVLGLDYNVLRFCKLYVSDVTTQYDTIAV